MSLHFNIIQDHLQDLTEILKKNVSEISVPFSAWS